MNLGPEAKIACLDPLVPRIDRASCRDSGILQAGSPNAHPPGVLGTVCGSVRHLGGTSLGVEVNGRGTRKDANAGSKSAEERRRDVHELVDEGEMDRGKRRCFSSSQRSPVFDKATINL